MIGAARRIALFALVGFGLCASAAGQPDDPIIAENDLLEMEILRHSDGTVLDSSTALVRRGEVYSPGNDESLIVTGRTVAEIEAAIAGGIARQKLFRGKVDVRVRILESRGDQVARILFSKGGEGIEGRSLKPIATGRSSSITIVNPPDILTISAVRRSDRFEFISGEHLVRPDGTLQLGIYENVEVAGLTVPATRWAITRHLAEHGYAARDIEVQIEVLSYRKVRQ